MRTYYVRPRRDGGYGAGESYENAWNGVEAVDWRAISAGEPGAALGVRRPAGAGGLHDRVRRNELP